MSLRFVATIHRTCSSGSWASFPRTSMGTVLLCATQQRISGYAAMIVSQTSRGAASWAARRYSAGFSDRRSARTPPPFQSTCTPPRDELIQGLTCLRPVSSSDIRNCRSGAGHHIHSSYPPHPGLIVPQTPSTNSYRFHRWGPGPSCTSGVARPGSSRGLVVLLLRVGDGAGPQGREHQDGNHDAQSSAKGVGEACAQGSAGGGRPTRRTNSAGLARNSISRPRASTARATATIDRSSCLSSRQDPKRSDRSEQTTETG